MIPWYTHVPMFILCIYTLIAMQNKDRLLVEKDKIIAGLSAPKIKLEPDEEMIITITKRGK